MTARSYGVTASHALGSGSKKIGDEGLQRDGTGDGTGDEERGG